MSDFFTCSDISDFILYIYIKSNIRWKFANFISFLIDIFLFLYPLIKWGKLHFTRHYQYWDHYDRLVLNQCLSPLELCVRFPLMAWCTLYIFIIFMLSSFRDLLQISGFIDISVSFTINHHLIGRIFLQVMLSTN